MEPESSLPYSQVPATCPYPEPTPSILHPLPLPIRWSSVPQIIFEIFCSSEGL